jgi:hypothetical protein
MEDCCIVIFDGSHFEPTRFPTLLIHHHFRQLYTPNEEALIRFNRHIIPGSHINLHTVRPVLHIAQYNHVC